MMGAEVLRSLIDLGEMTGLTDTSEGGFSLNLKDGMISLGKVIAIKVGTLMSKVVLGAIEIVGIMIVVGWTFMGRSLGLTKW